MDADTKTEENDVEIISRPLFNIMGANASAERHQAGVKQSKEGNQSFTYPDSETRPVSVSNGMGANASTDMQHTNILTQALFNRTDGDHLTKSNNAENKLFTHGDSETRFVFNGTDDDASTAGNQAVIETPSVSNGADANTSTHRQHANALTEITELNFNSMDSDTSAERNNPGNETESMSDGMDTDTSTLRLKQITEMNLNDLNTAAEREHADILTRSLFNIMDTSTTEPHPAGMSHSAEGEDGTKLYTCAECGRGFERYAYLKKHEPIHLDRRPHTCTTCGKSFRTPRNLRRHVLIHTGEKPFACVECDQRFALKQHLDRHMNLHAGLKPHTCLYCDKSFLDKCNLKTHLKQHSLDRATHQCTGCEKSFFSKTHLKNHMREHLGATPYMCVECGASFPIPSLLKIHRRTHTGEKPYVCEVCGKAFATGKNLRAHNLTHTGESPHACEVCDMRFITASNLKRHRLRHNLYTCGHCGRSFDDEEQLSQHGKTEGECVAPFTCQVCNRGFPYASNFKMHMLTHTGDRPFKCPDCGKGFPNPSNCKRHQRRVHGKAGEAGAGGAGEGGATASQLGKGIENESQHQLSGVQNESHIPPFQVKSELNAHVQNIIYNCIYSGKKFEGDGRDQNDSSNSVGSGKSSEEEKQLSGPVPVEMYTSVSPHKSLEAGEEVQFPGLVKIEKYDCFSEKEKHNQIENSKQSELNGRVENESYKSAMHSGKSLEEGSELKRLDQIENYNPVNLSKSFVEEKHNQNENYNYKSLEQKKQFNSRIEKDSYKSAMSLEEESELNLIDKNKNANSVYVEHKSFKVEKQFSDHDENDSQDSGKSSQDSGKSSQDSGKTSEEELSDREDKEECADDLETTCFTALLPSN